MYEKVLRMLIEHDQGGSNVFASQLLAVFIPRIDLPNCFLPSS